MRSPSLALAGLGDKAELERGGTLGTVRGKGQRRQERLQHDDSIVFAPPCLVRPAWSLRPGPRLRPCQACQPARPGPLLPAPSLGYYHFALNHFGAPPWVVRYSGTLCPAPVPVPGTVPVPVLTQGARNEGARRSRQAKTSLSLSLTHTASARESIEMSETCNRTPPRLTVCDIVHTYLHTSILTYRPYYLLTTPTCLLPSFEPTLPSLPCPALAALGPRLVHNIRKAHIRALPLLPPPPLLEISLACLLVLLLVLDLP